MNLFTIVFLIVLGGGLTLHWWLDIRQQRHVRAHRNAVPDAFLDRVDLDAHQKAADYTVTKTRVGMLEDIFALAVLLAWTLAGGLDALDAAWRQAGLPTVLSGTGVLLSMLLIGGLLELPLDAWRTFGIERRFGFNRSTPRLFLTDTLKQAALAVLIGTPLLYAVLWLMDRAGAAWWIDTWLVWLVFSVTLVWAYPAFIAPLFNRFTALDDPALKARIGALLERQGVTAHEIWVMDGSRRSGHGNAYLAGLGKRRRIVIFDTLLEQLTPEEIEAVLAHELGHYKRRHVLKQTVFGAALAFLALALLGLLRGQQWFFAGLGLTDPSAAAQLAVFLLVVPRFAIIVQPFAAWLSRRFEYQADAFAARAAKPRALIEALVKLYRDNAATLTPDPLYSAFHDSHPPAPLRVAHLQGYVRRET